MLPPPIINFTKAKSVSFLFTPQNSGPSAKHKIGAQKIFVKETSEWAPQQ